MCGDVAKMGFGSSLFVGSKYGKCGDEIVKESVRNLRGSFGVIFPMERISREKGVRL